MTYQHKQLASGRWRELSLVEQMANVGAEVGRAINWQRKQRADHSRMAAEAPTRSQFKSRTSRSINYG